MDATSVAASTMKALNFLATSTTRRVANPINFSAPRPSNTKPNLLTLYVPNSNPRNNDLSLTRCSSKPDTNTDNVKDQNPTIDMDLNSKDPEALKPDSNETPSSTLSSPSSSTSSSGGLVFDLGVTSSWDSAEIGSPVVKRFLSDEEERWYMWYYGKSDSNSNPGLDSIGLAVSSNGIHWERGRGAIQSSSDVGSVMNCGKDWWAFDTLSIRPSEVVIMSSTKVRSSSAVYWLYYTGYTSEKTENFGNSLEISLENPERFHNDGGSGGKIFKSLPGLAISQDGRHWARIEGEHHSGALFDVGLEKEWDSLFIASPQVVFHTSGDLRMYYHSLDIENGQFGIGIARSRDGIRWVKLGKIIGGGKSGCFDEFGVFNPRVVRNRKDGKYLMAYEGVDAKGKRSIGLAVSPDGLKDWTRFQDEGVLKPSMGNGWDNKGVGSPCLVHMDGEEDEWRMYYRGVGNGGRTGIGMALSQGSDVGSFRKWTGFHL
ncbi:hypothetical protein FEM48_Zijuj10G0085800 [Ziziphus jujuba var. spinosa]|uniref:Glycosyl hydrolase, five-bladed beta-propellor domain-containing protein n=1 Tax=Ziziphus jujuba var. spinosa TaxID=714518 RepID=A0A978UMC7_ZIZJJ|nr:hypothetical protein FEM48_Zijuj10G0085800 [Ziziphus jujuba var. spinosa]